MITSRAPLLLGNLRVPDDSRPALDLRAYELVELVAARRRGRHPQLGQTVSDIRDVPCGDDVVVYLVEQRCGHGGRRAYAVPRIDYEVRHTRFLNRRHVRQERL